MDNKKTVLVTGARGFVGSRVMEHFWARPHFQARSCAPLLPKRA